MALAILALTAAAAQLGVATPADAALTAPPAAATVTRPDRLSDGTQRWSILASPCAAPATPDEVVVCGRPDKAMRLPLPDERGAPDRPMPSNPNLTGTGALAAERSPCAVRAGGCQVGVDIFGAGTALIRLVGVAIDPNSCCDAPGDATNPFKLVGDIARGAGRSRRKPVRTDRVPIPLDDLPPVR